MQAWSVDTERTEAALKTLRLGHSYDGTNAVATETYGDFLSRSQQSGACRALAALHSCARCLNTWRGR